MEYSLQTFFTLYSHIVCMQIYIQYHYYPFHMRTKTGSNPGSTRFYEFRSHAPVRRVLCRLVTSVIAKMAYQDSLLVAILFTFLRLQRRRALRRSTHQSGETARRRVAHFRLRQKQRRTFFLAATLSYFARATSAVRTIWVKPRNHTSL